MGQAFSCLKPGTQDLQVSPKDELQAGSGAKAAGVSRKDVTCTETIKADDARVPSDPLEPAAAGGLAPAYAAKFLHQDAQTLTSPVLEDHPEQPDTTLDSSQLGGSTSWTASTNTTTAFSTASGYPYNNFECGPPHTDHEATRVQALRALDVLDTVSAGRRVRMDEEADMVLSALMEMFRAATAMLALFDDSRIVVLNAKGIIGTGEFPYRWSFCAYTLTKQRPQTLVVPDATKDMRFADNPFVLGAPGVRFYCGAPLVSASGHVLGTLCFADTSPRPGFDAAQCYLLNNMAELLVRQLERFRANAGPAGAIDAETTALTRVARTIECYEAVTGLVDISLGEGGGWMIMYVNEAWELLCAPWTRKQLVGRPLQVLMALEADVEPELEGVAPTDSAPGPKDATDVKPPGGAGPVASITEAQTQPPREGSLANVTARTGSASSSCHASEQQCIVLGGGEMPVGAAGGSGIEAMSPAERQQWRQRREQMEMQAGQQHWGDAGAGAGAREGAPAGGSPGAWSSRKAWRRYAAALRAGEEVVVGQARLLMEDGRPSTTLVRMSIRSANYHVLDAATRMPVGVPPQIGLPQSIARAGAANAGLSNADPSSGRLPAAGFSSATSTTAGAAASTAVVPIAAGASQSSLAMIPERPEPFYCFIMLTPLTDDAAAAPAAAADMEVNPEAAKCHSKGGTTRLLRPAQDLAKGGGWPSGAASAGPGTPCASSRLPRIQHSGVYDLSARAATRCSRPSLDSVAFGAAGSGGRTANASGLVAAASGAAGTLSTRGGCITTGASEVLSPDAWTYGMEPFPGLRLGHLLGKGGYGRVFAANYRGQKVAAKVISNSKLKSASCVNGVTLEALLAQEVEHPYIVQTYKCVVRSYGTGLGGIGALSGTVSGRPSVAELETPGRMLPAPGGSATASQSLRAAATAGAATAANGPGPPRAPPLLSPGGTGSRCGPVAPGARGSGAVSSSGCYQGGAPAVRLPPTTQSEASALPRSIGSPLVTAGPAKPGAEPGGGSTVAGAHGAAASVAPGGAAGVAPVVATAVATVEEPEVDSFDSFDGNEEAAAGGMIDQLVSGGGGAGPAAAPSHALPSYAPPSHGGMPSMPSAASYAQRSAAGTDGGGYGPIPAALTATVEADQLSAALRANGIPPRLPSAASAATGTTVFGMEAAMAAAAAAAGAGGMSYRSVELSLAEGETWILQEYCTGGTLQDAIDTGRLRTEPSRLRGEPHMPTILLTAQEVASAMQCLHSRGYMHGDLSAVNVLLTEVSPGGLAEPTHFGAAEGGGAPSTRSRGWVAKVSDFGLAKHLPDPKRPYVSSAYGVITHCAPEVLKTLMQTQAADVYSFGVLLWQMWTGARPWANMNRFQILGAVTNARSSGLRFMPDAEPPAGYRDLTRRCLSYDPGARPTFAELCEELRLMTYAAAAAGQLQG